jgi:hypothetical protein
MAVCTERDIARGLLLGELFGELAPPSPAFNERLRCGFVPALPRRMRSACWARAAFLPPEIFHALLRSHGRMAVAEVAALVAYRPEEASAG